MSGSILDPNARPIPVSGMVFMGAQAALPVHIIGAPIPLPMVLADLAMKALQADAVMGSPVVGEHAAEYYVEYAVKFYSQAMARAQQLMNAEQMLQEGGPSV